MSIGKALLRVRQEKGLTQGQVAAHAGLATSYVSRIENNHVQPTMGTVQRMAGALGVPLSAIFQVEETGARAAAHACPVSASGECIGELIRSHHGRPPGAGKQRYGKEELRLLRMADFLITSGPKDVRRALATILESFMSASRQASR